jgi:hypothetical protein
MRFAMMGAMQFAALAFFSAAASAAPVIEHFTVIGGGNPIGHVIATRDGDRVTIDYDVKNNGRGPTIAETLVLDADGFPRSWTITGSTTFGSKVAESFEADAGAARWTDSVGDGSAQVDRPTLYIAQSASPWQLGLYARALLSADDLRLPVLPAGEVRLEKGRSLTVSDGASKLQLRQFAISGLDLNPTYFLLDDSQALFATISPNGVTIRKGFEAEAPRLQALAAELSLARLEGIQQETAHRHAAPVRIRNVRVFDPERLALSEPVSVLVWGRRISSIQPLDAPASPGEVLVEGEGGTLVAGLHEMHGHISQAAAILNLAAGVTTMRDMGNNNAVLDQLVDSIESGKVAGPRIHRSGFIEGRSPFNSNNGILVASQAEALDAVRWYAARGYGQVKLYNSMNPAWTKAAVAEAHRLGLRASGHVPAFSNANAMIDAGYDELTHINQIMLGWVLAADEDTRTLLRLTALKRLADLDLMSAPVQHTLDRIVAEKVAVEPTIAIHENLLLNQDGEVPAGMADYLDHMPIGVQRDAKRAWSDMSAPGDREAYAAAYGKILAILRQMRERGVELIPGTDLGGALTFHRELQLFEEVGYTRAEVLRMATLDMARYLGQDQSTGSIEAGKLADFFLVAGDPVADLKTLKNIRMVVKDGTVYFPSEILPHFGIRPFAEAPTVTLPTANP